MREQQQSKLPKKGTGVSHDKAQNRMARMLENIGWNVYTDEGLGVQYDFFTEPPQEYYHEYDIYAEKKHANGLKSQVIIEIDGKIHNSNQQRARDIRAAAYAAFFIPEARFIRMPIELLLNQSITDKAILEEYKIK